MITLAMLVIAGRTSIFLYSIAICGTKHSIPTAYYVIRANLGEFWSYDSCELYMRHFFIKKVVAHACLIYTFPVATMPLVLLGYYASHTVDASM